MRIYLLLLLFGFTSLLATAQQLYFHKQWDKRFGGTKVDIPYAFLQTSDGGCLVVGTTNSDMDGDKSQPNWNSVQNTEDGWVVKVDSAGNKLWDKRFGGTLFENFTAAIETNDGYVFGGSSNSAINGDKTEASRGFWDYWIVKTDKQGNKLWDKRYGGNYYDFLYVLQLTKDGGMILGGESNSGIGFEKSEDNWDSIHLTYDCWVVKIDSTGNKQWDKRFGGTKQETLRTLVQTNDGGYLLGSTSYSDITGDKTVANWDTGGHTSDWWIVKIDSIGSKQWDKRYGTTNGDGLVLTLQADENSYLLIGGVGDTGINGDMTIAKVGGWYLIIDTAGNIINQLVYDYGSGIGNASRTKDGGYLFAGEGHRSDLLVYSPVDRTEDCLGRQNVCVQKLDSTLHKQWDKTIFTTGDDAGGYAIETRDGCYAATTGSRAGIGGYKTQAAWDSSFDFFIVKFCMDTFTGITPLSFGEGLGVRCYPNPFTTDISISLQNDNTHQATFTITDITGKLIYRKQETNLAPNYTKMLDLSYLSNGVYFITVQLPSETITKRVIKQ